MKKTTILTFTLLSFMCLRAQTKCNLQHELGLDAYPIVKNLFSFNQFGSVQEIPSSIIYRLTYKEKLAFRARLGGNYTDNDGSTYRYVTGNQTTVYITHPSKNYILDYRLGLQYNKHISEKSYIYGGVDFLSTKEYMIGGSSNNSEIINGANRSVSYSKWSMENRIVETGLAAVTGISTRLSKQIWLSFEMCYSFKKSRVKQFSSNINGSEYYSGVSLQSKNENIVENDIKTYNKKQSFIPMNLLMFSYQF